MLKLTQARTADAASIAELAEKIWRVHYPAIIGAEQVEYMLGMMYSAKSIAEQISNGQSFWFIDHSGSRVGYLSFSLPSPGELFIHKFYIDPAKQGMGIGKETFAELIAMNPGIKRVRLTVNRKNYKSINFYFRLGFVIEEVKDFDIGGGYFMQDFVMVWNRR
jgi:RimJ/RimL family protein N-acetyltransferase